MAKQLSEQLAKVRAAEEERENAIAGAKKKADSIVARAQEKARKTMEEALQEATEAERAIMQDAREKAASEEKDIISRAQKKAAAISTKEVPREFIRKAMEILSK